MYEVVEVNADTFAFGPGACLCEAKATLEGEFFVDFRNLGGGKWVDGIC